MRNLINIVSTLFEKKSLYEMANLSPRSTGLPMTIFVSPKGGSRHDIRIKVSMKHGDTMNIRNTAVVGLRPFNIIHGDLSTADLKTLMEWVTLNHEVLIQYWNGVIDTVELAASLTKV